MRTWKACTRYTVACHTIGMAEPFPVRGICSATKELPAILKEWKVRALRLRRFGFGSQPAGAKTAARGSNLLCTRAPQLPRRC